MTLIIPGVEIRVIKEVVPRQLGASGVLGIVGHTESDLSGRPLQAVGSLQEFAAVFGLGSIEAMPEVRQAFANGVLSVVCANLLANQGKAAAGTVNARVTADGTTTNRDLAVTARANGTFGNDIAVRLTANRVAGGATVDVDVFYGSGDRPAETFRALATDTNDERFFARAVNAESGLIRFADFAATAITPPPRGVVEPTNDDHGRPPRALSGGEEATPQQYLRALERLEAEADIDLLTVSQRFAGATAWDDAKQVYAGVISHCERMSRIARNRLGFGQIVPHGTGRPAFDKVADMASVLTSDHFVLVAPHGYLGAVVGLVGGLAFYESPTFKTLRGVTALTFDFSDSDLTTLLQAGVLPVDFVPRKGIAVVRGITTDQSQVSVTRIADRCVRHVQNIAQDFIGRLNTQAQRLALKQLIVSAFTRLEQQSALVPSTDGSSPAFQVEVESSQADFAQGIVRIHCAVRPVRAIDYIFATILVQA